MTRRRMNITGGVKLKIDSKMTHVFGFVVSFMGAVWSPTAELFAA